MLSTDQFEGIAADWIARRNGAGLSAAEEGQLAAWLAADPRHAAAFAEMEASWSAMNAPRRAGAADAVWDEMDARMNRRARRRRFAALATAGLAAALVLVLEFRPAKPRPAQPRAVAATGVQSGRQTLPDGSTVELNAGAKIAVDFTPEQRGVRLLQGEAFFTVNKDPQRAFVVTTGAVNVRAVGTAFTVRVEPRQIGVLVTEGRVAVERTSYSALPAVAALAKAGPVFVGAGERVVVPVDLAVSQAPAIQQVSEDELAKALAWCGKRVEFSETPLPEAIRFFNRRNRIKITLGDESLQKRLITGILWSDNPDEFERLLVSGFNLRAERRGDAEIVLYEARSGR